MFDNGKHIETLRDCGLPPEAATPVQTPRDVIRAFFELIGHGFTTFDRGGI